MTGLDVEKLARLLDDVPDSSVADEIQEFRSGDSHALWAHAIARRNGMPPDDARRFVAIVKEVESALNREPTQPS